MSDRQCMRHRHRVTLFCEECLEELQAENERLRTELADLEAEFNESDSKHCDEYNELRCKYVGSK